MNLPNTNIHNKDFIKHMVECNCVLPQFKSITPMVFHRFVVFSVITDTGSIEPSYAECNNCGAVHKVTEVGKSIQLHKETMKFLPKIEEIKTTIPEPVARVLETYKAELPTWQEVKFAYDNEVWGRPIILSKEEDGDLVVGKYLLVIGHNLHKVDSFVSGLDSN